MFEQLAVNKQKINGLCMLIEQEILLEVQRG